MRKLFSERLKQQALGPHPDPELLTAFSENSLAERDRETLLLHLGACMECREILYLATPELAEVQPVLAFSGKRPRLALRWATLAASVLIIGSVFITNRGIFTRQLPRSLESASSYPPAEKMAENAPAETRQDAIALRKQSVSNVRPPIKHMTAKPQASMQFDQSGEVHFAAAPGAAAPRAAEPEAIASAVAVPAAGVPIRAEAEAKNSLTISTPYTWNVSPAGRVQRSTDSGKTWHAVVITNGSQFHAVSSIGNEVWAGGNAGALYHSVNQGEDWTKVEATFAGKKLASDITQINFTDLLNGTVNTESGEAWSTSDGGKNWQLK